MKIQTLAIAAVLLLSSLHPAFAQLDTTAKEAIIVDNNTGIVLFDKAANEHMPTSSMSKTMTAYMVFDALKAGRVKLDDSFVISEKAWRMEGSRTFVKVGDRVKVEDLIRGMLIQSGNDATVALAEGLGGTEQAFVDTMNAKAQELGLKDSHFMNATGLPDPNHYSTPHDLELLASHIISDFPEYYHYFSEREFTFNNIHQQNRDPLLDKVPGADGLKTGHTDIGGYGLIGSAKRDGRRVTIVLNGMASIKERQDEGTRLMEWAFRNFESKTIARKGDEIDRAHVWLGEKPDVSLVAEQDVNVLIPVGQRNSLKMTVKYDDPIKAPVRKGDAVGTLHIEMPNQPAFDVKLVAGEDDDRKGLFGRVADRLRYLVTGTAG